MLACALLMGATCWRWSGAQARALSLEQAVQAMHAEELGAVPVTLSQACAMIDHLERLASATGPTATAARHALEELRKRLTR